MFLLYNSLTQKKEPISQSPLKLYVCGLTVYDKAHIGHLRTMLTFDLLIRYLRSQNKEVIYVRNITDVDDKIIARMQKENRTWEVLTQSVIDDIKVQEHALSLIQPNSEPKASEYIPQMIDMIQILIDQDYAYVAKNNDVYFSISSYRDYGKLSKQRVDELLKTSRVDGEVKKAQGDFILWKQSKPNEPFWDSPWGKGRPGWHIECSAISTSSLGDTFDIHGGGVDLKFPHHENEIAQSVCATKAPFAKLWMHVGHLLVNQEKMSKSLNNFITVEDFLNDYDPELIRLFLLKTHYRQPYNFTVSAVEEMQKVLLGFYLSIWNRAAVAFDESNSYWLKFIQALEDDLNVAKALAVMHEVSLNISNDSSLASILVKMGSIFGILQIDPSVFLQGRYNKNEIELQIKNRKAAREERNFTLADKIRDGLTKKSIMIEDGLSTRWYDEKAGILL